MFNISMNNGYIADKKERYDDEKDFIKECKTHYEDFFENGENFHKNVKIKHLRFSGIHECYYITEKGVGAFPIYEIDTNSKKFGKL